MVGELKPFESKPPLLRLGFEKGKIMIKLRTTRRMSTTEKGAESDPLKFLFVVLWACRESKQTRVNLSELKDVWHRLRHLEPINAALTIHFPSQIDSLGEKIRDWAKKINKDSDIRQLQKTLAVGTTRSRVIIDTKRKNILPRDSFISVSSRSNMGSQVEVWFPRLPINELDWDEPMYSLAGSTSHAIPGLH